MLGGEDSRTPDKGLDGAYGHRSAFSPTLGHPVEGPPVAPADPDVIQVASGADGRYALPLAVAIQSVATRLAPGRTAIFHLLDAGLGPEGRRRVVAGLDRGRFAVNWITPDRSGYVGLPLWGRMSLATYDKLSLPGVLDAGLRRVLWIDADTLVREDVAVLWDRPLSGAALLAAPDGLVPRLGARFGVAGWRELGLDPRLPYFNAGVLLADLDRWRQSFVTKAALDYLHLHARRTYFWDQEALNAVLAGGWRPLERRWNCSPVEAAGLDPALVHFFGNLKPWLRLGRSRWHAEYYEAVDRTAWKGWRPGNRTGRLAAWYEMSSLRRRVRRVETWGMRWWRWRTWRTATPADAAVAPARVDEPSGRRTG